MIKILYFASVKETLNCSEETFDGQVETVSDLIQALSQRGNNWANTLKDKSIRIAVNQTISAVDTGLSAGDEVAFFPPVTGG